MIGRGIDSSCIHIPWNGMKIRIIKRPKMHSGTGYGERQFFQKPDIPIDLPVL